MRLSCNMWLLALCLALPVLASAQSGRLQGQVVDPMEAAVVGAVVDIRPNAAGAGLTVRTDREGAFVVTLAPGDYRVHTSADGFEPSEQLVTVVPGATASWRVVLVISGYTDAVRVTAARPERDQAIVTATRTATPLVDVPQSVAVVTREVIEEHRMSSVADVVRYVPGVSMHQGENNRDQIVIRGNSSSADFYVNGVRDDVQYYRDLYNVERVEALKGPNGMVFGRGGGGGVVNRVTKDAMFDRFGDAVLQAGSYGQRRFSTDVNQQLASRMAVRLNAVVEEADSFRDGGRLQRYGVSPTVTITPSDRTKLTVGYERFHDERVADRGIPSYRGRPLDVASSRYFGNASDAHVGADVDLLTGLVEYRRGQWLVRNRSNVGAYDRGYQNYVPGAVSDDRSTVAITAYNNRTRRVNVFNQTDVLRTVATHGVTHRLLLGAEAGRQQSDNLRLTGYFGGSSTQMLQPLATAAVWPSVVYRASPTDADNLVRTSVAALYLQDQAELSKAVQLVGGLRADRFDLTFHNRRSDSDLRRVDVLLSPRVGVIVKPRASMSVYGSYSVSFLPSAGDQFASLTTVTQQVQPERFTNYEVGAKWDVTPAFAFTSAIYRLERTNTRSTDPNDPTHIIQTGAQRTDGMEVGVSGKPTARWTVMGGYAFQDASVIRATTAARAGAVVGQVPRQMFSLWNAYQVASRVNLGVGIVSRADMFAAIDNTVVLPGYARADASASVTLSERTRLQVHAENLTNRRYVINADGNNNISPGSPRAIRVSVSAGF